MVELLTDLALIIVQYFDTMLLDFLEQRFDLLKLLASVETSVVVNLAVFTTSSTLLLF